MSIGLPRRPLRARSLHIAIAAIALFVFQPSGLLAQAPDVAGMEMLLAPLFKPDQPGAAVIVVKDGKTLFRKGYGMADMERGVRLEPDMVFRLGSITKQFTAVAVLMLVEEGKVRLDDDITTYLPDYPTQGHRITVEHLLTHTSGIKSYTSLPEYRPNWRKDISMADLIAVFKNQPMDFAPGQRWLYNNSAYVLAGAVIEKASGKTYEEFIDERIFKPLGMTQTYYGNEARLIPRRVLGYSRGRSGVENAEYLSMTVPFSAGALLSTVDDLARWDAALYADRLVKSSTLQRAWSSARLEDGTPTKYGYGWAVGAWDGHRTIEHGGGINGFHTYALRLPDDKVFVAILCNNDGEPALDILSLKLALLATGKPWREPTAISRPEAELQALEGLYQIDKETQRIIRREGQRLTSQRSGGSREEIFPLSRDEFFFKDSTTRLRFERDPSGEVIAVTTVARYGPDERAPRTNKPVPTERQSMALDPGIFERYAGEYELAPGFVLRVFRKDDRFMTQATGQSELEIFAESETEFFLKVVDAQLTFQVDASGKTTGVVLHQGGHDTPGRKVK